MSSTDTVVLDDQYKTTRNAAIEFAEDLQATLNGDGVELPSLPHVAMKIRQAIAEENASIERITGLVGSDPAVAARLLKVANCALFHHSPKPVQDIRTAVMRLGLKAVRDLTLSIAAQQVFLGYASKEIMPYVERVWRHSVHVATLSHLLTTHAFEVPEDEAFLAGLLHEIGKLYMLLRAKQRLELFDDPSALQAILNEWQAQVGGKIMRAWELPEALVDATENHGTCPLSCTSPLTLTQIVAVANHLAEAIDQTNDVTTVFDSLPDFGALKLDRETLEWMMAASVTDAQQLHEALAS